MPVKNLRREDCYTGVLTWNQNREHQDTSFSYDGSNCKRIYITVGTQESMATDFLPEVIDALLKEGHYIIVSKGGRNFQIPRTHECLEVHDFLDENALLTTIDLWISHGSAMSIYNGLYYGVPIISLPVQADQHFHSVALLRLGVGDLLRPRDLRIETLLEKVKHVLTDAETRTRCNSLRKELTNGYITEQARQRLSEFLKEAI
ncbi:glycosyltransferase [Rubripirellula amarantea]|nr:glycosyltransferase [Rubripirellula amarantea]